jgi:hypothetical protein
MNEIECGNRIKGPHQGGELSFADTQASSWVAPIPAVRGAAEVDPPAPIRFTAAEGGLIQNRPFGRVSARTAPSAPTFDHRTPLRYPCAKREQRAMRCLSIAIMAAVPAGKPKPRQPK